MLNKIRKYFYLIRTDLLGFYHNFVEKIELPEKKAGEDIFYLKIGDGGHKIIFVSAIHGNELGTVKLVNRLIEYLDANKNKFQEFTFFIVPCLNYDGCRLAMSHLDYLHGGRIGRFNNNKVDLNRNFPTKSWKNISKWSFGKNYEEKKDVNCGSSPGSEKEVSALCDLIKREGISVFFSFHNVGRDVMPNDLDLAVDLADIYRKKTGFCLQTYDDWKKLSQTGTAREWCNENNISYLEIECPHRWGSDWPRQKEAILSCLAFFQNKNND